MREREQATMNNTVYIAVKEPMRDPALPQKCRIGVCEGTPILENGWILHLSLVTEDADKIHARVMRLLGNGAIRIEEDDAWYLPIEVLDDWMKEFAENI